MPFERSRLASAGALCLAPYEQVLGRYLRTLDGG